MDLSLKDRVTLANQCRILERLYPEEAEAYAEYRMALERGSKYHYDKPPGAFWNEMQVEASQEVVSILDMHRALRFAYDNLEDKSGINERDVSLGGFDGNGEGEYLSYAKYICMEGVDKRWPELHKGVLNSHCPMLGVYRRMLDEWNRCVDRHKLTKDDIMRITSARAFAQQS